MVRRSTGALALALALLFTLASPALAGGWAVTTLDAVPTAFRADESYSIGFTVRQHGITPARVEQYGGQVAVRARPVEGGPPIVFPTRPQGAIGHYVADVRFPRPGGWEWDVTQGPFAPQPLGSLTVAPAAAPAVAPAAAPAVAPAAAPAVAPAAAPAVAPAAAPIPPRVPTAAPAPPVGAAAVPAATGPRSPWPALGALLPLAALFAAAATTLALVALARRPDLADAASGRRSRAT